MRQTLVQIAGMLRDRRAAAKLGVAFPVVLFFGSVMTIVVMDAAKVQPTQPVVKAVAFTIGIGTFLWLWARYGKKLADAV